MLLSMDTSSRFSLTHSPVVFPSVGPVQAPLRKTEGVVPRFENRASSIRRDSAWIRLYPKRAKLMKVEGGRNESEEII
jgi:hypothetical protein